MSRRLRNSVKYRNFREERDDKRCTGGGVTVRYVDPEEIKARREGRKTASSAPWCDPELSTASSKARDETPHQPTEVKPGEELFTPLPKLRRKYR
jgi:hypothetical protein